LKITEQSLILRSKCAKRFDLTDLELIIPPAKIRKEVTLRPFHFWRPDPEDPHHHPSDELSLAIFHQSDPLLIKAAAAWKKIPFDPKRWGQLGHRKLNTILHGLSTCQHSRFSLLRQSDVNCFYGGSFNPCHEGHQHCVEDFPQQQNLTIVVDNNPQKALTQRDAWTRFIEVWHMAPKAVNIYMGHALRPQKNPTVFWIEEIKKSDPQKTIELLLGEDSFISLPGWVEYEKLLSLLNKIWVVPRGGKQDLIQRRQHELEQRWKQLGIEFRPPHPFENISSTQIRQKQSPD
jgi:nicotinic acid mononucleotide adenylyltransferase